MNDNFRFHFNFLGTFVDILSRRVRIIIQQHTKNTHNTFNVQNKIESEITESRTNIYTYTSIRENIHRVEKFGAKT